MKQYVMVTREISRIIHEYEIEIKSHECEDSVITTFEEKEEWDWVQLEKMEEVLKDVQVTTLKPKLQVQIEAEAKLREWIERTKEECEEITVTVTDLDKIKETIQELEQCPPGTLDDMEFDVTEWAGSWVYYRLSKRMNTTEND